MAKGSGAKTKGMHSKQNRKARGRTSITGGGADMGPRKTNPNTPQEMRREATRPQRAGAGKQRGDRRDMNKLYTNNARPDVLTRKR